MNIYSIVSISAFTVCTVLGIMVYLKKRTHAINISFAIATILMGMWCLFPFLTNIGDTETKALFYTRLIYTAALFTPPTFLHFIFILIGINQKRDIKTVIIISYTPAILFLGILFHPLFIKGVLRNAPYCAVIPGPLYPIYLLYFGIICTYTVWKAFLIFVRSAGAKRNQLKYLFIAFLAAFIGGIIHFLSAYGIKELVPHDFFIITYVTIMSYCIARYKLLDITLAFREGLAFLSYTTITLIVILPPIILFGASLELTISVVIFLVVTAPFIHQHLKKRALSTIDILLFKGKYEYQNKLEKFIDQMILIPKEEDLFKNIAKILGETLGLKKIAIFIFDNTSGEYHLRDQFGLDDIGEIIIPSSNGIISWLKKNKEVFVKEEMEKILEHSELEPIERTLNKLGASVCIPAMLETDLVGIVVLGEKASSEMYSHIDTGILYRLGTQLAVALDYKKIEAELRKKQEYAAIGQLAFEITHEMKNLLAPISTFLQLLPERLNDPEFINTMSRFSKTNVDAINRKVEDILYFGQEQKLNLSEGLDINKILTNTAEGLRPLAQKDNIPIATELGDIPNIIADEELLLHVFNNLIINAIDAMNNRTGKIRIRTQRHPDPSVQMKQISPGWIRIEVKDDGGGIPDNVKDRIFTAFVTTKSGGGGDLQKRGMGLGLTIVKKIIDQHHGIVGVNSSIGKGTTFIVDLPVEQEG